MQKYERIKKLGEGGFGQVFLVRDKTDQKLYVQKEIDLSKLDEKGRAEAVKEASFLQQMRHPNIIAYKEYVESTSIQPTRFGNVVVSKLNIIMQYADGGDLEVARVQCRSSAVYCAVLYCRAGAVWDAQRRSF